MTTTEHPSVCTFDCPDTCSLTVTVTDGRITKVRGSEAAPFTAGVICAKVAQDMPAWTHGPHRILHPLRRTGPKGSGQFEPISWQQALDAIHDNVTAVIDRWGPQAVAPLNYAGPHGMLAYESMSARFLNKLGASQLYRRSLCGGVRAEAWSGTYGNVAGLAPEYAAAAQLNIVWGNNATVANLHLVRRIRQSMRNGGKLVVVDPLRTKIAEQADLHIQLLPGSDTPFAWAVAAELERINALNPAFITKHVHGFNEFMELARPWTAERAAEVCGIPVEHIRTLALWMAEKSPLVMAPGNGLERGRHGGSAVRAAIALPALLGKFGNGSGIVLGAGFAFPKTITKLQRPELIPPGTRTLNLTQIGRHLTEDDIDPPIRALFIYNHNPIVVHPDQNRMRRGLQREDVFSVGIDVSMNESMTHCDIVLPAANHFEYADLYGAYGQHWLQRATAVIAPPGEAQPNTEIFRRLAARFSFDDPCFKATDLELMDDAVDPADPRLHGVRPSQIPLSRAIQMQAPGGKDFVLFETTMPATPTGKIELKSATLAERWGAQALLPSWSAGANTYPLRLISPASNRRISSTLGELAASAAAPPLLMHPADAAARALKAGDEIRLHNKLGEVFLPLVLTDAVPPGVVASEKGAWLSTSRNGQTISALVDATMQADLATGACYNDTRVDVAAA